MHEVYEARRGIRWRAIGWGFAAFVLLLPFVAMQVTDEMKWDAADFVTIAVMLAVAGGTVELAARAGNGWYRAGAAVAVGAGFLLILVNLAVGLLGSEDNPANLMFAGVLAVAIGGSFIGRFRATGMARAMLAAAAAQVLVGGVALAAGLGSAYEIALGTGLFTALWLGSTGLFRKAAARAT